MDTLVKFERIGSAGLVNHRVNRKIAYILTPVEFGGAERVSLSFLQHYHRRDTTIFPILLCRPWESDNLFVNELTSKGFDFCIIPTRLKPREQGGDCFRLVRCAKSIYAELKKGQFDLVHTNGYFADITGLIVARLLRIPIISTCHGFISNDTKLAVYNVLDVIALRFMNQIITVSDRIKSDLAEKGIKEKQIQVVQNAVEVIYDDQELQQQRQLVRRKYGIRDNEVVLGYVGRLSIEKGIKYLIKAGIGLAKADVLIRILIIGDGPQSKEIKQVVQEQGLGEKVIFAGFQKNVAYMLPAFDVFVLPSLTEGTSMALLEAMACGLPVIATAVGGTPKVVISEKNGMLVPPESPEAIVHAVITLSENTQLREKIGRAALNTIESEFSINRWLGKIDDIYSDVIQGNS